MMDPRPPLSILELLARVGEEHIRVQSLVESLTNAQTRKRGDTLLTFGTNQITATDVMHGRFAMTGLIVWMPTLLVQDVIRRHRDAPADLVPEETKP